jgi:hypothetical protein
MDINDFKQQLEYIATLPPEQAAEEYRKLPHELLLKEVIGIDMKEEMKRIQEEEIKLKELVASGIPFEEALDIVLNKT